MNGESSSNNNQNSDNLLTVGIDIGSESSKIVLGPIADCEIVRSDVGGHTTPTAVSFSGKSRLIGEAANLRSNNTIYHLNRLLPDATSSLSSSNIFESFYRFDNKTDNNNTIEVDIDGDKATFDSQAVLAMLLGKIHKNVVATLERRSLSSMKAMYILTIPPGSSNATREAILDAAHAAGLGGGDNTHVVDETACTATAYKRKFPEVESRTLVVVDMGHAQTSVSVLRISSSSNSNDNDTEKKDDKTKPEQQPVEILASTCHKCLGAGVVDIRLWEHFVSTLPALKDVKKQSRPGQRLLEACKRLKHLLSQLPDGSVTAENIDDRDVPLSCSQATLGEICSGDAKCLQELIASALTQANVSSSDVDTVEVLGGGCRIPLFKSTILNAFDGDKVTSLSHSLDDTSVALGASVLGKNNNDNNGSSKWVTYSCKNEETADENNNNNNSEKEAYRQKLFEAEQRMAAIDALVAQRGEIRNKIEAHVLEMRSAMQSSKYSALFTECSTELNKHLDESDDWLFSDEAHDASIDKMEETFRQVTTKTKELCTSYFETLQKEQAAQEQQLEEEAKKAQAEREAAGGSDDEADHDTRKLPTKRRMEIVMKNKAEANELFSDGNYRHAAARYTKALTHAAKFVDLNPTEQEEVKGVKLSLNMNLALAYFKLQQYDQSLRVCNEALSLDENSTKALYRRASCYYEKKQWDNAKTDLQKAQKLQPDDKAIPKLLAKVDAQLKRVKAKEKKMAQKMFG